MSNIKKYPYLAGISNMGVCYIKNDLESVANFICKYGPFSDTQLLTLLGEPVLDTYGLFVNKCTDPIYMEELRPVLVEKQLAAEIRSFREDNYAAVFSVIEMNSDIATGRMCVPGIPTCYDDLRQVPNFEDQLSDVGLPGHINVKVISYQIGEGEQKPASVGDMQLILTGLDTAGMEWIESQKQLGTSRFAFDWNLNDDVLHNLALDDELPSITNSSGTIEDPIYIVAKKGAAYSLYKIDLNSELMLKASYDNLGEMTNHGPSVMRNLLEAWRPRTKHAAMVYKLPETYTFMVITGPPALLLNGYANRSEPSHVGDLGSVLDFLEHQPPIVLEEPQTGIENFS